MQIRQLEKAVLFFCLQIGVKMSIFNKKSEIKLKLC